MLFSVVVDVVLLMQRCYVCSVVDAVLCMMQCCCSVDDAVLLM